MFRIGRCGNPKRVARSAYGGLLPRVSGPGGRRSKLWGADHASSGACGEACERRAGESPLQSPVVSPGRAKTQGSIQRFRRPNQTPGRQGLSRGSKPRNRGLSGRPVAPATVATAGETVCGSTESETTRYLVRGVSSEGWIPRALSARKKAGAGLEGANREEGSQTLNAEGDGHGMPVWAGPPSPVSAVGSKSPWEELFGFGRTTRVRWDYSQAESETRREDFCRLLNCDRRGSPKGKPHSRGNGQRQSGTA